MNMLPFDPEMKFGPWMFYIALAATFHTTAQAGLAGLSLIFQRAQGLLLTLGTSLAMCSGAGFLISFAWGSDMDDPEQAILIAWKITLAAAVAGPLLFTWALTRWRAFYDEMASPTWTSVTNLGGCGTFLCAVALNFTHDLPSVQLALALMMLFFLIMYWSPVFLLPWRYLTRMDPMNFMRFLVLLLALTCATAHAAPPVPEVTARVDGRVLTLAFPAGTLHDSVWLKLDGQDVPHMRHVRWSSATDLTVDLHHVKRRLHTRWVSVAQVWGQERDGTSLLQTVSLPGHRTHSATCGCK